VSEYPPKCKVHGSVMHLEPLERGKTMWVCDDCERDYKAMVGKLFRFAEGAAPKPEGPQ